MTTIDTVFEKELEQLGAEIEEKVMSFSLADAIRSGSSVTGKALGWGSSGQSCALTAAAIHIRAMQDR